MTVEAMTDEMCGAVLYPTEVTYSRFVLQAVGDRLCCRCRLLTAVRLEADLPFLSKAAGVVGCF